MTDEQNDLESIKKLLVLQLRSQGVPVEAIAKALGVKAKTIKNQFPMGKRSRGVKTSEKKD